MKYLAILRDSLREAIDSTTLYIMLALSGILTLVIASISYTLGPVSEFPDIYTILPLTLGDDGWEGFSLPKFLARKNSGLWIQDKVEPLDGATDSPASPLRFKIRKTFAKDGDAAAVRKDPEATMQYIRDKFANFRGTRILDVKSVEMLPPPESKPGLPSSSVYFEVVTHPTKVTRRIWPCEQVLFFGLGDLKWAREVPLGLQIHTIENVIVGNIGAAVAIIVSVIITGFSIPNMLRKGSIDLLIVKPIRRTTLLLYKYIGGLTFIFLNTSAVVFPIWLVIGIRSGIWAYGFLLTIPIITFFFAILYSISTLVAVFTRSAIAAILLTCFMWGAFVLSGILYVLPDGARQAKEGGNPSGVTNFLSEGWFPRATKAVHFVLPRYSDLNHLTTKLLVEDLLALPGMEPDDLREATFSWKETLAVDFSFIGLMLGLACIRFATKDY